MTAAASPLPGPLYKVLAEVAASDPEAEALAAEDGRMTYGALLSEVDRIARALIACGLKRGDHIGILQGNSVRWATLFYAAASLGLVSVPLNTRFRTEELRYTLDHEDIRLLFTADMFLGKIDFLAMLRKIEPAVAMALPGRALPLLRHLVVLDSHAPKGGRTFDDFLAHGDAVSPSELLAARHAVTPADILLIQFTSGTTSFPKGVQLSHRAMLGNAKAAAGRIGVRPTDRYYSPRPFYHVAGTTLSLLVALVSGACLVTSATFEPGEALAILERERCALTSGNETMFAMMLAHPSLPQRRLVLRGGWAAASDETMRRIDSEMGATAMVNAYGLSEASPNVVISDHSDSLDLRASGLALPHPGMELRICDPESGNQLAAGEAGELQLRGWSVMQGYYKRPDATAAVLDADGWLRTGDLGRLTAEGRFQFIGRLKDVFRVGGENVAPMEVETVLQKHPAVAFAQVVGVPDARLGEVPAAFVTLRAGRLAAPEELIAFCKERCANFKVPRYLDIVESFEAIGMTGSSKVQKNKLRDYAIARFELAAETAGG